MLSGGRIYLIWSYLCYMPNTSVNYTVDQDKVRWPGSGSAIAVGAGNTPFGYFDGDAQFQLDAPKSAVQAAFHLGYPSVVIEMRDYNFYAYFEEAILEYIAQVNQFNIRNNISLLQGLPTNINVTQRNIQGAGVPFLLEISKQYGTETGTGGTVDWKRGAVSASHGVQTYDLQKLWGDVFESGSRIEVKRIFHSAPPASARIYDPFSMTGMSYSNVLNEMGFAGYSPATQFLMTPIFEDLLRMQAIEFNDLVRKSAYSFELVNNKLRLFPIPTYDQMVYFEYVIKSERDGQVFTSGSAYTTGSNGTSNEIGDYSNVPYNIIPYANINEVGKQWIRKYFLALCKEVLGAIRQKYQTIPIPGGEVSLDGGELRQEAAAEKTDLITQLRENLEAVGRKAQMENQAAQAQQLQESMAKIPLLIYVGAFFPFLLFIDHASPFITHLSGML